MSDIIANKPAHALVATAVLSSTVLASLNDYGLPDAGINNACCCVLGHGGSCKAGLGSWQGQRTLGGESDVLQRLKELQEREAAKAAGARILPHMCLQH